jgi:phosphoribulokinase
VGDSAAGKTTISRGLVQLLGPERVTHVCTDDYHKYDRRERAELGITALHPDCNYLDVMELHLERLHYGQPILKPVYDHSDRHAGAPRIYAAAAVCHRGRAAGFLHAGHAPVLRCEGLSQPARRAAHGLEDQTRYGQARLHAGTGAGGAGVKREPDSRDFIRPQRKHADIVVQFYPPPGVRSKMPAPTLNVRLTLRPTIPHPDLSLPGGT